MKSSDIRIDKQDAKFLTDNLKKYFQIWSLQGTCNLRNLYTKEYYSAIKITNESFGGHRMYPKMVGFFSIKIQNMYLLQNKREIIEKREKSILQCSTDSLSKSLPCVSTVFLCTMFS